LSVGRGVFVSWAGACLSVGRGVLVSWAAGGVRHHEARRVHGCPDALGRPRQDHGAGQQRRVLARPDNQLRAAEDLVRGVRVLGELTVGAMRPFLSVGRRVGHTTSTRRAAQARISPSHGAQPPSLLLRRRRRLLLLPPSLWPFPANHLTPVLCHRLRAQITPDRPGRRASRTWHTLPFSREVMRSASGSPTTCPRAFPLRYLMTRTRSIQANPSPNGRTECGKTPDHLRGAQDRPNGAEGVEGLALHPLVARALPVPRGHVVGVGIAQHVGERGLARRCPPSQCRDGKQHRHVA
jgi:hypothetical protein